jgi:hypothetical protein
MVRLSSLQAESIGRVNDGEAKEVLERIVVTIAVQKGMTVAEAECGNQAIDSLAHGVTALAKTPEISRRGDSQLIAARFKYFELAKVSQYLREGPLVHDSLEGLTKNQIR